MAPRHPVHLIAVTAHDSEKVREMTAAAGFELHFVKPIDWGQLSSALSALEHELGRAELISYRTRHCH